MFILVQKTASKWKPVIILNAGDTRKTWARVTDKSDNQSKPRHTKTWAGLDWKEVYECRGADGWLYCFVRTQRSGRSLLWRESRVLSRICGACAPQKPATFIRPCRCSVITGHRKKTTLRYQNRLKHRRTSGQYNYYSMISIFHHCLISLSKFWYHFTVDVICHEFVMSCCESVRWG